MPSATCATGRLSGFCGPTAFFTNSGVIMRADAYAAVQSGNVNEEFDRMFLRVTLIAAAAITAAAIGSAPTANAQAECPDGYYWDSDLGECVHRPEPVPPGSTPPPGATALCRDGDYSFSQHPYANGTCHGHGGVQQYL
jgi:Protein of unknown function (DUF3761)